MLTKTHHQISIYEGNSTLVGNLGVKFHRFHGIMTENKPIESIKFYDKKGNAMEFKANEIYYWEEEVQPHHVLCIRYSGWEYKFSEHAQHIAERFRGVFQYDVSQKNEVLVEITTDSSL